MAAYVDALFSLMRNWRIVAFPGSVVVPYG